MEKAYDKAWFDMVLYTLGKNGIRGPIWRIIRRLNQDLSAKIRTKFGLTRIIKTGECLRQGSVLSVTEFAKMIDELNTSLQNAGKGKVYANILIPALLLMDDIAMLADSEDEFDEMLQKAERYRLRYRMKYSPKKTKVMIINGTEEDYKRKWKLGNLEIDTTDQYTYLGDSISADGSLVQHIKMKEGSAEGILQNMLKRE